MFSRDSENVERRELSRFAPRFHIELRADTPDDFRLATFRWKHPSQKKQIARPHRFHIDPERLRWNRRPTDVLSRISGSPQLAATPLCGSNSRTFGSLSRVDF